MTRHTPPLIGLLGKARSGKDSVAAVLTADHGYTRVAFADPLKRAALALDPLIYVETGCWSDPEEERYLRQIVDELGWERAKDTYPQVRETLQKLGSAIRELDPDFWLDAALDTIEDTPGPVVITDVRYPNEADAIRARGGVLVRVLRPGLVSTDQHASEVALDRYPADRYLHNDGTLDDLAVEVRSFLFD